LELQRADHMEASLVLSGHVLEADPDYGNALFVHGFALQQLGRNEEAVEAYERHLRRWPDDSQVWFNLAYAFMELGAYAQAVPAFETTLRLRPDYSETHTHLIRCYEALGQPDDAERHRRSISPTP